MGVFYFLFKRKIMEQVAVIKYDNSRKKFVAMVNGRVVGKSGSAEYLKTRLLDGSYKNMGASKVSKVEIISGGKVVIGETSKDQVKGKRGKKKAVAEAVEELRQPDPSVTKFDINQRFGFMNELINMVITKKTNSIIICGPGGLGKTYSVLEALKTMGKRATSWMDPADQFELGDNEIDVDDTQEEIEAKIVGSLEKPGDYALIKGFSTPKALYRTLYDNRNKIVVFDDCDSVLRDPVGSNLLKAALDSYDERWVSWRTEGPVQDDLPEVFRFTGSVIFISNLPQWKIDQAIRTRAFVIDLEMTIEQRIERMRNVLADILPEYGMKEKKESLAFMEEFKHVAKEINFRTLMNVIKIRVGTSKANWKDLAEYSLTCM
jgi:hypothetical protein